MPRNPAQSLQMREQAREAIMSSALEIFGERGFSVATTAEVAARAGVSKGLVFNYFPTKAALLQALIERVMGDVLDFWDRQSWHGSAEDQLARLVESAVSQVCERPHFYRLYFSLMLQPGESRAVEAALARLRPRLDAYVQRTGRLMVELGSECPELDSKLFQCALNGLAQAIVAAGPAPGEISGLLPVEALKARLVETFVERRQRGA